MTSGHDNKWQNQRGRLASGRMKVELRADVDSRSVALRARWEPEQPRAPSTKIIETTEQTIKETQSCALQSDLLSLFECPSHNSSLSGRVRDYRERERVSLGILQLHCAYLRELPPVPPGRIPERSRISDRSTISPPPPSKICALPSEISEGVVGLRPSPSDVRDSSTSRPGQFKHRAAKGHRLGDLAVAKVRSINPPTASYLRGRAKDATAILCCQSRATRGTDLTHGEGIPRIGTPNPLSCRDMLGKAESGLS
ncbi:hypothetical protein R1flu_011208 [Riccia fluitans]|uniref:Uncharacterized protein n=1 Tax=Riccia fluitans TaxID=41844 RepID=A0ABD1Z7J0_9MARC